MLWLGSFASLVLGVRYPFDGAGDLGGAGDFDGDGDFGTGDLGIGDLGTGDFDDPNDDLSLFIEFSLFLDSSWTASITIRAVFTLLLVPLSKDGCSVWRYLSE